MNDLFTINIEIQGVSLLGGLTKLRVTDIPT